MGEVLWEGSVIEFNDEYSSRIFGAVDADIPSGITVYCSDFSHPEPSDVFQPTMTGVKFVNCNLDNCNVPAGNEVVGGTQRQFLVQNDGNDWEIDAQRNPVRILNAWIFAKYGLPEPLPSEIPAEKSVERIDWLEVKKQEGA